MFLFRLIYNIFVALVLIFCYTLANASGSLNTFVTEYIRFSAHMFVFAPDFNESCFYLSYDKIFFLTFLFYFVLVFCLYAMSLVVATTIITTAITTITITIAPSSPPTIPLPTSSACHFMDTNTLWTDFYFASSSNTIEWKYLAISMISVATAMLCKEQGITMTAICAVYEIFVVQKVTLTLTYYHCFRYFILLFFRSNFYRQNKQ